MGILEPCFMSSMPITGRTCSIEKLAGIANPKDFRNEVVMFSLRSRAQHAGKNPSWTIVDPAIEAGDGVTKS
jgi:predicted Ser/Thr protein kinase